LTPGLDPDATAFINAAAPLTDTEQSAIRTLVSQLKSNNIWSGLTAFYPFVGNTADQQKYNLVNPQDTNAAFRLTFYGGWTHSSSGLIGNGIDSYADTNWNSNLSTISASPTNNGFKAFGVHVLNSLDTNIPLIGTNSGFDNSLTQYMVTTSGGAQLLINMFPPAAPNNTKNIAFSAGTMQHMVSMKYQADPLNRVYFEWSTNGGSTRNTSGPFTDTGWYANGFNVLLGRQLSVYNVFTTARYNCFYIAAGTNALNTFGGAFEEMTTITTICKQFATNLGR
jgi:hypothetical protein